MSEKTGHAKHNYKNDDGCGQPGWVLSPLNFSLRRSLFKKFRPVYSWQGRMGEACGALTGAYLVIGLKHGKAITDRARCGCKTEMTYRPSSELA